MSFFYVGLPRLSLYHARGCYHAFLRKFTFAFKVVSLVSKYTPPPQCEPGSSQDMPRAYSGEQRLTDMARQIHFSFERNKLSASWDLLTDVLYGSLIVGAEFLISQTVI